MGFFDKGKLSSVKPNFRVCEALNRLPLRCQPLKIMPNRMSRWEKDNRRQVRILLPKHQVVRTSLLASKIQANMCCSYSVAHAFCIKSKALHRAAPKSFDFKKTIYILTTCIYTYTPLLHTFFPSNSVFTKVSFWNPCHSSALYGSEADAGLSGLNHMQIPLGFSYNLKVLFKLQPAFSTTNNVHNTKKKQQHQWHWLGSSSDQIFKWDSRVSKNTVFQNHHLRNQPICPLFPWSSIPPKAAS